MAAKRSSQACVQLCCPEAEAFAFTALGPGIISGQFAGALAVPAAGFDFFLLDRGAGFAMKT